MWASIHTEQYMAGVLAPRSMQDIVCLVNYPSFLFMPQTASLLVKPQHPSTNNPNSQAAVSRSRLQYRCKSHIFSVPRRRPGVTVKCVGGSPILEYDFTCTSFCPTMSPATYKVLIHGTRTSHQSVVFGRGRFREGQKRTNGMDAKQALKRLRRQPFFTTKVVSAAQACTDHLRNLPASIVNHWLAKRRGKHTSHKRRTSHSATTLPSGIQNDESTSSYHDKLSTYLARYPDCPAAAAAAEVFVVARFLLLLRAARQNVVEGEGRKVLESKF